MSACEEPDCTGSYGPHGYCDECGSKAPAEATTPLPPAKPPEPPSEPGSGKQGVHRPISRPISTSRFGAGWVSMPHVSRKETAPGGPVPEIEEAQRFCGKCKSPVGRGRDGKPGRARGYCTRDGTPFCFEPTLEQSDSVDRYEIDLCIARGGQGWIYLAHDTHFDDTGAQRPVVLKGVIDSTDPDAIEQARQERRFLIEVDHPNIVKVHDFVRHPDPLTGTMAGYLVMEYIDGRTLLDLHRQYLDENGHRAPLPLTHVLAYGIEILQAMAYLHEKGLLYCDFKPDNAMHTGDQLKLIDLGAVVRADNVPDMFLGTVGYQAPEIRDTGPTVASDLYTVGRSLAVLSFTFEGFTQQYCDRLPRREDVPVLAANESFDLLLRRATHRDPAQRFSSAEQMRGQLEGVLLELLARSDAQPPPVLSRVFTVEQRTFGTDLVVSPDRSVSHVDWSAVGPALPTPLVDPADPAAGHLAAIAAADPDSVIDALRAIPVDSPEVVLQLVGARIAAGQLDTAHHDVDTYALKAPHDWRVPWYRGLAALAAGRPHEARPYFEQVYAALPGELPPKLALAAASEWDGDDDRAGPLYERVWRTDTRYVSAAFGYARVLERRGELTAAVAALDGVPEDNAQHTFAQVAAIRTCLSPNLAKAELLDAGARLKRLRIGIERQAELSIEVFAAALDWVRDNGGAGDEVLGRPLEDRQLRFGLEKAYRDLAGVTEDVDRRIELVRTANRVRPRTLF